MFQSFEKSFGRALLMLVEYQKAQLKTHLESFLKASLVFWFDRRFIISFNRV